MFKNLERNFSKIFASPEKKKRAKVLQLSISVSSNINDVVKNKTSIVLPFVKKEDIKVMKKLGINEVIFINNKKLSVAEKLIESIDSFVSPCAAELQINKLNALFELSDFTVNEKQVLLLKALKKIILKYEESFNYLENPTINGQKEAFIKNWEKDFPEISKVNSADLSSKKSKKRAL